MIFTTSFSALRRQDVEEIRVLGLGAQTNHRAILAVKSTSRTESYATPRDRWIEINADIKGGEPVIHGTRIGVRGVAQRLDHGDTIEILTEDYPQIPAEAFQTAHTYARAHPRRGRPTRPWRNADEALDRRGPLPVTG